MRLLISLCAVLLMVTGCANLKTIYTAATTSTVSPKAVYVAEQTFDGVEQTATNYIVYCTPKPRPVGCSDTAIQAIKPAIRSGQAARSNLVAFMKAHPGQLGDKGLYDALVNSTSTVQAIIAQYNVGENN